MKKLLFFVLMFLGVKSYSQTLNYYKVDSDGKWQTITLFIPAGDTTKAVIYYNSSTAKSLVKMNLVKDVSKDGVDASLVTMGISKAKYLLITTDSGKHIIMTDEKQMFTNVFDLDSKILNPSEQKPVSTDYTGLLIKAFKYLLL